MRVSTLVLDEPTVGLDTAGIAQINDLIRSLRHQGKAVVVITHDREIAAQADRVVTILDGRVHEESNQLLAYPSPATLEPGRVGL